MRKSEEISCDEIKTFRILKLSFLKSRRRGVRRSFYGNEKQIHISGRHALELQLNDGRKLVIGTQRPKELESAMKQMKSPFEPA
jgi:tRNA U54 and U55 pseudouridine synthase Pus10